MFKKSTFFLSLLLITACTKFGKNITVKGRVFDPITGEGIKNIEIKINNEHGKVKSTNSDANGEFEVSKLGGKQDYTVESQYDDIYFKKHGWSQNGKMDISSEVLLKKGEINYIDLLLIPFGKIIFDIKNVNCEGSTDYMNYHLKHQYDTDFKFNLDWREFGCVDHSRSENMLTGKYVIRMEIERQSGITTEYDTFFVSRDVVNTFIMEY